MEDLESIPRKSASIDPHAAPSEASHTPGRVNERFAEAVTNQAFALTMSKAMVWALNEVVVAADEGRHYFANDRAFNGLERRGLVVATVRDGREVSPHIGWRPGTSPTVIVWLPTLAGRLVLELCRQAGLQPNPAPDALVAAMADRQRALAQQEAEVERYQEARHAEWKASIRLKPTTPAVPASAAANQKDGSANPTPLGEQ